MATHQNKRTLELLRIYLILIDYFSHVLHGNVFSFVFGMITITYFDFKG